ncbi:MAG: 8-oxoguanine deaminase [Alphaproteobacteria bacterium]
MADAPATGGGNDRPLWIRNPLAMLCDGDAGGGLVVADGQIVELVPAGGAPRTPDATIFDASAHVVLPGLINTHHHFYQTLTRACPPALDKPLFPWLQALYPIWSRLTPEAFRLSVRVAFAELMLSGTTTASDHHYLFPSGLEDAIDIQVEEAQRLGLRAVLTRGSMSLSQDDGGLPPRTVVQREDTILADCERLVGTYHQDGDGAMVQIALAPCSPFSVTRDLMRDTAALAAAHGLRLHTHLAETRDEEDWCRERFGCRPVDYLEDVGWLNDRVWLAHGIWFSDPEVTRLGRAGVGVCHCPSSNMILASGTCRTLDLEAAGTPVGLGVDGSASNDGSDMIGEVRQAFLLQRLAHGAERVSHRDALRWATEGSARCLGRRDIGRIAPGLQADLALFTLNALRFSGAGDPLAALVLCGGGGADRVMVQGSWVVEDGRIPGLDLDDLRARHQAAARALLNS